MPDQPSARRNFYEMLLDLHIRHHGEPDGAQRNYLGQLAIDLVASLGPRDHQDPR